MVVGGMGKGSPVRMKVHGGPMGSPELSRSGERERTARLAAACDELEAVLESVDLDDDSAFADALVDAVSATHRAYEQAEDGETHDGPPARE